MKKGLVITIDGPAGVGKSTVSKALAERLTYTYLDTGALYRAMAYMFLKNEINMSDETAMDNILKNTSIHLDHLGSHYRIFVNDEDVTDKIRTENIALIASQASSIARVRSALLDIQRRAGSNGGIVAEGRDMGTVVFPDADVKFFLDASDYERTKRRHDEFLSRGETIDWRELAENMAQRDKQDRGRPIAPLRAHPDAIIIDSTTLSVPDVIKKMMTAIERYL
jgi:CMP/dCMP kinase